MFIQVHKIFINLDKSILEPLLKNRKKLTHSDKIWKSICEELNWEYISSI